MIIIDVQRGGPSTGLPTKTEQADLLQAMFGRNGECPAAIVAPCSPADCFNMAFEAVRMAVRFMTPVFLLSDGYLANGAEPWLIPNPAKLARRSRAIRPAPHEHQRQRQRQRTRRQSISCPTSATSGWSAHGPIPGTPGLEHRIGGLEKEDITGNVSYDPANHEHMVHTRAQKIANIAKDIPELTVIGPTEGDVLVIGWGGTYGAHRHGVPASAAQGPEGRARPSALSQPDAAQHRRGAQALQEGAGPGTERRPAAPAAPRHFLVDAVGLNKIQGRPFLVSEIEAEDRRTVDVPEAVLTFCSR